jgi:lipoprotein-anchoring transpeptidase ErfK/SrfK
MNICTLSRKVILFSISLLILISIASCAELSNSSTSGVSHTQQIYMTSLAHAESIGVPQASLIPIMQQGMSLQQTHPPLFASPVVSNQYYTNVGQRYQSLDIELQGVINQAITQTDHQAYTDLQSLDSVLLQRQSEGFIEAKPFAVQLDQLQSDLSKAQYPSQYTTIATNAQIDTTALRLMSPVYSQLTAFQRAITQLQHSNIDTTGLKQEYQTDLSSFRSANSPQRFTSLSNVIVANLQQANALSIQAIPYVGSAKLQELNNDITLSKQYGVDVTAFQKDLSSDQALFDQATSVSDYLTVASKIDSDLQSIQLPMIQGQTNVALQQFHNEVTQWGNSHQYHDSFDGSSYPLDYPYMSQGIGSDLDSAYQSAQTISDYQTLLQTIQNDTINLHAMEADSVDTTAWNQPHTTDMQVMQLYNLQSAPQVVVVSLVEQSWRLYENGKLVQSFQITSGQYQLPSPPGMYSIFDRESPTVFKSSEPQGSAFWYPNTNINFAMEYRAGGYFFHDSWWRVNYGIGTNFPHYDTGGDESFAGDGSHGCINMQEANASWMYANTNYGLPVILY